MVTQKDPTASSSNPGILKRKYIVDVADVNQQGSWKEREQYWLNNVDPTPSTMTWQVASETNKIEDEG